MRNFLEEIPAHDEVASVVGLLCARTLVAQLTVVMSTLSCVTAILFLCKCTQALNDSRGIQQKKKTACYVGIWFPVESHC